MEILLHRSISSGAHKRYENFFADFALNQHQKKKSNQIREIPNLMQNVCMDLMESAHKV